MGKFNGGRPPEAVLRISSFPQVGRRRSTEVWRRSGRSNGGWCQRRWSSFQGGSGSMKSTPRTQLSSGSSRTGTEAWKVFSSSEPKWNHRRNPGSGHPKTYPIVNCNPLSFNHRVISSPSCPDSARTVTLTRSDVAGDCPGFAVPLACITLWARSGCSLLYGQSWLGVDAQPSTVVVRKRRAATEVLKENRQETVRERRRISRSQRPPKQRVPRAPIPTV